MKCTEYPDCGDTIM